jgi:fatty-acyl-CoA synthase
MTPKKMNKEHFPHWPAGLPLTLTTPQTTLVANLDISALRYPEKIALVFFDKKITYRALKAEVDLLAAYSQQSGIKRGDRVILQMQNSPQFMMAFYAILRADAIVVPVNPMLLTDELRHTVEDSGAEFALSAQELLTQIKPLLGSTNLRRIVVACYADYLTDTDCDIPSWVSAPRQPLHDERLTAWSDAIAQGRTPATALAGPEDLACMPYTSGTTGRPKGCMHTHSAVMYNAMSGAMWAGAGSPDHVVLLSLPLFHVTGMQISMNAAIYAGATLIIMPRWDRDLAGRMIAKHQVTSWTSIPTMMIDFLSNPKLADYDITSLKRVSGGGSAMPAAIAQKLLDMTGLRYMEGYGLSETIATSHSNPIQRLKQQCLGIPIFGVDSRIIDPETHRELPANEIGEIIIHGPQVLVGYWRDEQKTREAFIEVDGKKFFRSGDLGYRDDEGFFFFTDRLKRMINASGYKVWPAEVEAMMYKHPEIQECCIISTQDDYRGETVKAVVVKKLGSEISGESLMEWARTQMAAYKVPRVVSFVDVLPKSATGKVMWRQLQEAERAV